VQRLSWLFGQSGLSRWVGHEEEQAQAGDLHVGEHVGELNGRTATIAALAVHPGAADYYNLTVSQLHTYAVGASHAVVHNTNGPCLGGSLPDYAGGKTEGILDRGTGPAGATRLISGQMEAFFRTVAQANAMPPQDPELWRAHGMELLGPPLSLAP
jgi:hypothetical protein